MSLKKMLIRSSNENNYNKNCNALGLAWYWRIFSRLAVSACSIAIAFLILSPVSGLFRVTYFQVNAAYISQQTLSPFEAPHLRVEIRYYLYDNSQVVTYIYPQYRALPPDHKIIPIYYLPSKPRTAYYAGPGGDERLRNAEFTPILGEGLGILGVYLLCSTLIWRRQVRALVRTPNGTYTVRLRWYAEDDIPRTVVVTSHEGRMEYSWRVLPAKTPVDEIVACLQNFFNVKNAFKSGSPASLRPERAELSGSLGPHRWVVLYADGRPILPISRVEPVIGTGQSSKIDTNKVALRVAHRRLFAAYATALGEVRQLPNFIRPPSKSDSLPGLPTLRTLLCWRALVRIHVELDIRRQLRCLTDVYVRSQMLIISSGRRAEQERLQLVELRDECQLLSASLINIRSRIVSLILGSATVLPPLLVIIKVHQFQLSRLVQIVFFYTVWSLAFLPGILILRGYIDAFLCKRRLFASLGIYDLENEVFAKLGQRKRVERMWDCYARVLVLSAWTAFWAWQFLSSESNPYPAGANIIGPLIVVTILLAWWLARFIKRRSLEER
jgi:hypothetical protein